MTRGLQAGLLLAALVSALPALAHRQPECLSTLRWSPDTQHLEVTHRLHLHDVERALSELFGTPGLRLADVETRARFALYLESKFAVRGAQDGSPAVPLELVGAELDGSALLVYQEYSGALPDEIAVRSDVLRQVSARQRNQVLVRTPQRTVRLDFNDDVSWRQVQLAPEPL